MAYGWFDGANHEVFDASLITPTDVRGCRQELPTAEVTGPQTPAWEPRWLDRKDERALVRAVERYGNLRDIALTTTLLQTGLRVGELVALELDNVELSPARAR